jgi:hypothetical protein
MTATRKLPNSLTKKGQKTTGGEHLLPQLSDTAPTGFVGVRSGKLFARGYVVYVGRDVTPEMMLEAFCERHPQPADRAMALRRLEVFVQALQSCKVGNLLSVSYTAEGLPSLKVEQEYLLSEPDRRLP